jgi:hypothetical protein
MRCWAEVRQESGFDVVSLNLVSPSDGPDYTIAEDSYFFGPPDLPGDDSFLAARWSFVVTDDRVRPYIAITFDRGVGDGKAYEYEWHHGKWEVGGWTRCGFEGAAVAFIGTYFFLDFITGCSGNAASPGAPNRTRITIAEPGQPPATRTYESR